MKCRAVLEYFVVSLAVAGVIFCVVSRTMGQLLNHPFRASGLWRSELQGEGKWSASLAVIGNAISGTMQPEGWAGVDVGEVTGTISAGSIQMGVVAAGDLKADFAGALTLSGIKGTYQTTSGDRGEWEGTWQVDAPLLASNDWPPGTVTIPPGPVSVNTTDRRSSVLKHPTWSGVQSRWWPWWKRSAAYAQQGPTNALVNNAGDGGYRQNEPEIAVDPFWPNLSRIVAGAIDYSFTGFQGVPRLGAYVSTDGGVSWTPNPSQIPIPSTYNAAGDPVLDFDCLNSVFYAGLAFDDPLPGQDGCSAECCDIAVVVSRGHPTFDGGVGWDTAVVVEGFGPNSYRTVDKPWLAVDQNLNSAQLNNVYVTYTRSTTTIAAGRCRVADLVMKRSTDGGQTFGPLIVVADIPPINDEDNAWSQAAVDLNSCLNVMWVDKYNAIQWDKCVPNSSGGANCGADRFVAQITLPPSDPVPGTPRNWFPSMAIDVRGTSPSGYIYVVWNDGRSGNSDIYFNRSIDGGAHFQTTSIPIAAKRQYFECRSGYDR